MKTLLLIGLLSLGASAFAQEKNQMARVNTRQGVEVYVYCQPLRAYEVVKRVSNEDWTDVTNAVADAINGTKTERCKSLMENLDILIENSLALTKKKKNAISFDAIMTDDGTTGTLIKWKE